MNYFGILMDFLRDREKFLQDISNGKRVERNVFALLISSSIFFSIYGAILGSLNSWQQMLTSALKLPALYLLTLFICLPTLYFFDVISGSKRSFSQYMALLLASMGMISVLLFGFAPVTLFFRISIQDYNFFVLLNVAIMIVTGAVGIKFFQHCMSFIGEQDSQLPKYRKDAVKAWLFLYGFVGSQLAWTIRPFFGAPGEPFQLFRQLESNFYAQILKMIGNALGF